MQQPNSETQRKTKLKANLNPQQSDMNFQLSYPENLVCGVQQYKRLNLTNSTYEKHSVLSYMSVYTHQTHHKVTEKDVRNTIKNA